MSTRMRATWSSLGSRGAASAHAIASSLSSSHGSLAIRLGMSLSPSPWTSPIALIFQPHKWQHKLWWAETRNPRGPWVPSCPSSAKWKARSPQQLHVWLAHSWLLRSFLPEVTLAWSTTRLAKPHFDCFLDPTFSSAARFFGKGCNGVQKL